MAASVNAALGLADTAPSKPLLWAAAGHPRMPPTLARFEEKRQIEALCAISGCALHTMLCVVRLRYPRHTIKSSRFGLRSNLHLSLQSIDSKLLCGRCRSRWVSSPCRTTAGVTSDAALLLRDVGISLPELPAEDMDEENNGATHGLQARNQAEAVLAAMAADVPLRRALLQVRVHSGQLDFRKLLDGCCG